MQPSGHYQAVLHLHEVWKYHQGAADRFLQSYLKKNRYIGSKDRQRIGNLFFGLFRYQRLMDYYIEKAHGAITPRLRLLTYLHTIDKLPIQSIQSHWSQGPYPPSLLTSEEQQFLEVLMTLSPPQEITILQSVPPLFEKSLRNRFDAKEIIQEVTSLNEEAPLDLRVNTMKIDRLLLQEKLAQQNIQSTQTTSSPWGLRLEKRQNLQHNILYKKGYFDIQDEGAQRLVLETPLPEAAQNVPLIFIDYCAGAGGKTLAFAQRLNNRGKFIACDTNTHRLAQSQERFKRHGLSATFYNLPNKQLTKYQERSDIVFVDVPCTGSGIWRRHPELKWAYSPEIFQELLSTQQSILNEAAAYVKVGGILAYATCSLLPEENEQQTEKFLSANPQFICHKNFFDPTKKGRFYTPFSTQTDGYYLCCFTRL